MDKALADRVKELRCGTICHSWRRIAEIIASEFPDVDGLVYTDEDSNICGFQIEGKELCDEAAKFLGEDPGSEDWN
jgi:hypothetical protein